MRTTLDVPDGLIEEAQRLLGFKSKTDTVVRSLRELTRRQRVDELRELLGSVTLDVDVARSRRHLISRDHASRPDERTSVVVAASWTL